VKRRGRLGGQSDNQRHHIVPRCRFRRHHDFEENHNGITTNQHGLFALRIGTGTAVVGSLLVTEWGINPIRMEVKVDGNIVGARSQLVAVPYAMLARDVENDAVDDADADSTNELQSISKSGNTVTLSQGGGSVTDEVQVKTIVLCLRS
jgi:hypothetical protein